MDKCNITFFINCEWISGVPVRNPSQWAKSIRARVRTLIECGLHRRYFSTTNHHFNGDRLEKPRHVRELFSNGSLNGGLPGDFADFFRWLLNKNEENWMQFYLSKQELRV